MPDSKIDPLDVGALERSVNDSATRVSAIWFSFVVFSAYLAAAASNISHRQLLLEEPIKLPTINIDLPLVASATLLPLLFVIYHVYVLLQVVLLARTAEAYNEAIDRAAPEAADSTRVRQRLANTLFAQLFAGSPREREGVLGGLLRLMAWITLAIAPVLVLIVFEIRFLPYHGALITWMHRALIVLDLAAVLLLWAGAVDVRRDVTLRSLVHDWKTALGAAVIVVFTCVVAAFPGEPLRFWTLYGDTSSLSEGNVPECRIHWLLGFAGVGYDRLVLRGEDFVEDEKLKRIVEVAKANGQKAYGSERTRLLRGRDLRCGRLSGSDLRHIDFSGADLTGAVLRGARLEGATFPGARLDGAILDGAQLQEAFFGTSDDLAEARVARPKSDDDTDQGKTRTASPEPPEVALGPAVLPNAVLRNAQLLRAYLKGADLRGSDFTNAQLNGAVLDDAKMQRTKLVNTAFAGASLRSALLHQANLQRANLDGVLLEGTQLQGASLSSTTLRGAALRYVQLQGARFNSANLEGAVIHRTQLQGAKFERSTLRGAAFVESQLQGARFVGAQTTMTGFSRSLHWASKGLNCAQAHVIEPNSDAVVELIYDAPVGNTHNRAPQPIPADAASIAAYAEKTYADVGESEALRKTLTTALTTDAEAESAAADRLKTCATRSAPREDAHAREVSGMLVRLACGRSGKYIGLGLYQHWIDDEASPGVAAALARALGPMDSKECPGLELYDAKMRERLLELAPSAPAN